MVNSEHAEGHIAVTCQDKPQHKSNPSELWQAHTACDAATMHPTSLYPLCPPPLELTMTTWNRSSASLYLFLLMCLHIMRVQAHSMRQG
jgi:hypothetical protein